MRPVEWGAGAGSVLAAGALAFVLLQPSGPSPSQFEAPARHLRAQVQPQEVVFLLPAPATRAREWLGDLDVRAVRRPWLEDLENRHGVWIWALFGQGEEARRRLLELGAEEVERTQFEGPVDLIHLRLPRPRPVLYDFVDRLDRSSVQLRTPTGTTPCRRRSARLAGTAPRLQCPGEGDWLYVAPEWHRMGERPRRCLWAHPPSQGELEILYPGVPLNGALAGRGGHTLYSSRRARAPVDLTVRVETATVAHGPVRFTSTTFRFDVEHTWRPFRLNLEPLMAAGTSTGTVSFSVSTSNAGANHFCFAAEVRGAPEGSED